MPFKSMGLAPSILHTLKIQNYQKPYPIQKEVIPAILDKKDVLGIAKTGSGKTAGYVIPVLMNLLGKSTVNNRHIDALVLVPTRELAVQVNDVFRLFEETLPEQIKTLAVFGGASINPQMKALQNVSILVATPGRLLELVDRNAVKISNIKILVLDEADKMLNSGFADEMKRIFELLPVKRQNLLFSATINDDIENMNQILLRDPVVIKIESDDEDIELIK
ncbi:MAG: DEAD/DEAH box helicase [Spirochaetales bacterium]|uniref:DEAD/DEAH box helicase n=1 Tax=Candidatus Thalassospirochaeta sargassi TaxID=3119039 RepID=A0AAJ1ICF3_9SPIO|nr:DEAD/DEAH box helicase [Spirochaetales bacterium]